MSIFKKVLRTLLRTVLLLAVLAALAALTLALLRYQGYILLPMRSTRRNGRSSAWTSPPIRDRWTGPSWPDREWTSPLSRPPRAAACGTCVFRKTGPAPRPPGSGPAHTTFSVMTAPASARLRISLTPYRSRPALCRRWWISSFTAPIWSIPPTLRRSSPSWPPFWTRWKSTMASSPFSTPLTALTGSISQAGNTGIIPCG